MANLPTPMPTPFKRPFKRHAFKAVATTIAVSGMAMISGCQVLPVAAWEKGVLAEPTMSSSGLAQYKAINTHVYTSKETARGGDGVAGGGCGCN